MTHEQSYAAMTGTCAVPLMGLGTEPTGAHAQPLWALMRPSVTFVQDTDDLYGWQDCPQPLIADSNGWTMCIKLHVDYTPRHSCHQAMTTCLWQPQRLLTFSDLSQVVTNHTSQHISAQSKILNHTKHSQLLHATSRHQPFDRCSLSTTMTDPINGGTSTNVHFNP